MACIGASDLRGREVGFRASALLAFLWLTLGLHRDVEAIVTRHDRRDVDYQALAAGREQAVELSRGGGAGMATLIAPTWLLTAAHVAGYKSVGQEVALGDSTYVIKGISPHPRFGMRPIQHDIALIELDRPVADVLPAKLYDGTDELGMTVVFVGSGDHGSGLTGPETRDKIRRAATNQVIASDSLWVSFRFDPPETALYHEGISGPGDSGGAAFVESDSRLWVIGVSSWQDTAPTERVEGRYGVIENYTRVSTHRDWILSVMER